MSASQAATAHQPEPWVTSERRLGTSPVERKALARLQREIASMPASLVVQIALWPLKLSDWARQRKISSAMVYNCLAGTKPYEPVRDMLAESLGVSRLAIDRLIEAKAPPPISLVPPDPLPQAEQITETKPEPAARPEPVKPLRRTRRPLGPPKEQIRLEL